MNEETKKRFKESAEQAIAEQEKKTWNIVKFVIPTAIWMMCIIGLSVLAFNQLKWFPAIVGIVADTGAIAVFVNALKKYKQ